MGQFEVGALKGKQYKVMTSNNVIKYDSSGCREGLSEVLASRFISLLDIPIPCMRYKIYSDSYGLGCRVAIRSNVRDTGRTFGYFLDQVGGEDGVGLYTAIENSGTVSKIKSAYCNLVEYLSVYMNKPARYFTYMCLLDALTLNTDRSLDNILVVSSIAGRSAFSPVFDFGESLGSSLDISLSAQECYTLLVDKSKFLMTNFIDALSVASSVFGYGLRFKGTSCLKVRDLYDYYEQCYVDRAVDLLKLSLNTISKGALSFTCV